MDKYLHFTIAVGALLMYMIYAEVRGDGYWCRHANIEQVLEDPYADY